MMPLWTDSYMADTQHLTNEEHGAYLRLLMIAWRSETGTISFDHKRLAIMLGVGPKKWANLWKVLAPFFSIEDGQLVQKRLLKERNWVRVKRDQQSQAGKASALKKQETPSTDVATEGQRGGQRNVNPSTSTSLPPSKEGGRKASESPKQNAFGECLAWLILNTDKSEGACRGLIGKWRKAVGDAAVIEKVRAAEEQAVSDPVAWISAAITGRSGKEKINPEAVLKAKLNKEQKLGLYVDWQPGERERAMELEKAA